MSSASDLYAALGIPRDATPQEIKSAHRARSKETHPDLGGDRTEFEAVMLAMRVLLDEDRRARYDRTGAYEDDNPDNLDGHAIKLLDQLLTAIIRDVTDPATTDVVARMRDAIHKADARQGEAEALRAASRKRIRRMRKRFRSRKGQNSFHTLLDRHLNDIDEAEAQSIHAAKVRARALELLADYEYDVDLPRAQHIAVTAATAAYMGQQWGWR